MGKKLGEDLKIRSYVVLAIFIKAAVIFLIVTALFPGCNKGGAETSAPAAPSTAVNQPAVGVPEIERGKTVLWRIARFATERREWATDRPALACLRGL